jgi:hypothetical protein
MEDENDTTTIRVKFKTKRRLDEFGNKGDSYDDLLNRLIDEFERGNVNDN